MNEERMHLLIVDDDRGFLDDLSRLMAARYRVVTATGPRDALAAAESRAFDAVLLDLDLGRGTDGYDVLDALHEREPGLPVIMVTKESSIDAAVTALRRGAVDYIDKRPDLGDLEQRIERALREQRLVGRSRALARDVDAAWGRMIGGSAAMQKVRVAMERAAVGASPVLIIGETGTGKELVARGIARLSRREGGFRALNCAAIPTDLVESELFGSERGAFTGSHRRIVGAFEDAQDGTLFLDEITEMEPGTQAKLLRVLEEREFRRLGGGPLIRFRGRVIASTNREVRAAVVEGRLREDLYYRLSTFVVRVPALRERAEDVPALVEHFLAHKSAELGLPARPLEPELMRRLCGYDWPGNVRQLQSAVERHLTGSSVFADAYASVPEPAAVWSDDLLALPYKQAKTAALRRFQSRYLGAVLASHGGNVARAARSMGVSAFGLQKMLRALELGGAPAEEPEAGG